MDLGGPAVRSYHSAVASANGNNWFEDVLWERVRKILEDCDSCQGLVLVQSTSNSDSENENDGDGGVFAGWGTALLREWHDECPNTCQLVLNIDEPSAAAAAADNNNGTSAASANQDRQQKAIRRQVQRALQLADQSELADAYLPLQLPALLGYSNTYNDLVASAAAVAAALESGTLPYRLAASSGSSHRSLLGLQSYYSGSGSHPYGTAPNLSYREFVRSLQRQSVSRNVLELDALLPTGTTTTTSTTTENDNSLYARLRQGTSLERDHRMRQPGYDGGIHRERDALPGEWMMTKSNSNLKNIGNGGGLLSSLSPTTTGGDARNSDRSLHHHYALSTSLRPPPPSGLVKQQQQATTANYVTCIMESMGIRYRPEQSMATVVDQSLAELTADGYGAGSYWKSVFTTTTSDSDRRNSASLQSLPVLATLGNTTRIYPFLHQTALDAQQIVSRRHKRSVSRALYNRDAVLGILPEADDCEEAVTACWDLRDSYAPPEGSGLVVDEEGSYFVDG